MQNDIAGKKHWDDIWETDNAIPPAINPNDDHYNNTVNRRLHQYFKEHITQAERLPETLLEIGAARSQWLPYFAKEFELAVTGLDYSEIGCQQAQAILENEKVPGTIVCADLFDPPREMLGTFDVVLSIGVLEHFGDSVACLQAMAQFLAPGGIIITQIPNMSGLIGAWQKFINPPIFEIHMLITAQQVVDIHEQAGLDVKHAGYFMFAHAGVANMHGVNLSRPGNQAKYWLHTQLQRANKLIWIFENRVAQFPANRWTSPYVMCTATKPQAEDLGARDN